MTKVYRTTKERARRARLFAHNEVYKLALPPGPGYEDKFVPGEGSPLAKLVIIGEAPGKDESWQQRPFVGRSGALLNECLDYAGIAREDIYITNIVKYRPPNNADPDQTTAVAAVGLMRMELNIIKPLICVPLGRYACQLWWPQPTMGLLAGQRWMVRPYAAEPETPKQVVMPMHHPSWALRNGKEAQARMKTHMRQIREALDGLMRVAP